MNAKQRGYLAKTVKESYQKQRQELMDQLPKEPSLNNYVISAVINGTLQFKDFEEFKHNWIEQVKMAGASKEIVQHESDYDWRSSKRYKTSGPYIKVNPLDLFEIPEGYEEAVQKYADQKARIEGLIEDLDTTFKTLELKIQVSSNTVMDKIVAQVDDLSDLNLIESRFMLGEAKLAGTTAKLLENKGTLSSGDTTKLLGGL